VFLEFYGLREQPFGVTPDPNYLYLDRKRGEVLSALRDGVQYDRGFMALIAEPGMGKTTLLYRLMEELADSTRTVYLFQTQCEPREFFRYILSELGSKTSRMGLVAMHNKLNKILFNAMLNGKRFVVIVDEAQDLQEPVLETIRLLSDFETPHAKLLTIILSGQPHLAEKLAQPAMSQLKQRIAIVRHLEPLSTEETAQYIYHRLRVAGLPDVQLFEPEAMALIARQSRGVPREINNICFDALSAGEARKSPTVSKEIVEEVLAAENVDSLAQQMRAAGVASFPISAPEVAGDPLVDLALEIKEAIKRRAYELFEARGYEHGHDREDWWRAECEILLNVAMEISEGHTDLVASAVVPGFPAEDLKVQVSPHGLCILGKRDTKCEPAAEMSALAVPCPKYIFQRWNLACEVDPTRMETTVYGGQLRIRLPKTGVTETPRFAAMATSA
jgi:general secretion pathway protein A